MKSDKLMYRGYFFAVALLGCGVLALAVWQIIAGKAGYPWLILAALAGLAGRIHVRLPGIKSKTSIAETFIFTNIILFGPAAGCISAALDGFLGSLKSKAGTRRLLYAAFNVSAMAISAYVAGQILFYMLGHPPTQGTRAIQLNNLILPAIVMAVVHWLVNTTCVATIAALEIRKKVFQVWKERFVWIAITDLTSGSAASLIAINVPEIHWPVIGLILPIILVCYFAFKTHLDKAEERALRKQLDGLYMRTVEALSVAIDARETGTLGQARLVQLYARGLARAAKITDESQLRGIEAAALLLDIGNLAVPEYILNNPGELSPSEFRKVMIHPVVGSNILSTINFPYPLAEYVRHHHERWNGSGYPDRLEGEQIPLGARILAIADCYVALTCDRPHQMARKKEKAMEILRSRSGTFYDPELVRIFDGILDTLEAEIRDADIRASGHPRAGIQTLGVQSRTESNQPSANFAAFLDITSTQKEAVALHEWGQALGAALHLEEVLALIMIKICDTIDCATLIVYLQSPETGILEAKCVVGQNAAVLQNHSMEVGENLSGWVAANREPVVNARASRDFAKIGTLLPTPLDNALIFPLSLLDSCIGTISLYTSHGNRFTEEDAQIVANIAQKAAPALRNALRYEEARGEALTDPLTSLPNMRFLQKKFEGELSNAKRHHQPLTLLVLDLDGFKAVNDNHGHQAGDRLLVDVAQILRSILRAEDLLVRQGGDEFAVALYRTNQEEAEILIERMRKQVDDYKLEVSPGRFAGVGISVGRATYPEDGETLELLMKKADAEMYRNKYERKQPSRLAAGQR